jgi:RNA polymerase-binding transcription factor DksA
MAKRLDHFAKGKEMKQKPDKHAALKTALFTLRKRLTHAVDASEEALREDVHSPGELSNVPTHNADHAAEGVDEEIAIAHNEERMLADVEAALGRIEAGTFGRCTQCGREIEAARLKAIPYTPRCIACAQWHSDELESPG